MWRTEIDTRGGRRVLASAIRDLARQHRYLTVIDDLHAKHLFFFQAEDGIRDYRVTEFRRVLFRSCLAGPRVTGTGYVAGCGLNRFGPFAGPRSEKRRVGEECRSRWAPHSLKKKTAKQHVSGRSTGARERRSGPRAPSRRV